MAAFGVCNGRLAEGHCGYTAVSDVPQASSDLPRATLAALMLAVFAVSVGFGILLPLLPYQIERLLGAGVEVTQVSWHTGLLTAVYTLSLFLFAPLWGRISDRRGPRGVLLVGLIGLGATLLAFSFVENLAAIYAERFLSGMFAAAVTPVAAAVIGNFTMTEQHHARRLSFISMAGITGFLLGPMLGVFVTRFSKFLSLSNTSGSVATPLVATSLLALFAASTIAIAVPSRGVYEGSQKTDGTWVDESTWLVPKLLILSFIVSAGIGVFEVGIALRGKQELGLTQYQIALMFTECSFVMFLVQAIVFSPWAKPEMTRWLIAPAFAVMAAGLYLVPRATDFMVMLVVIGAVAASAGILSPILTYWISRMAGKARGAELGKQTAAASLGATVGSAVGGLLFDVTLLPGASFLLVTALSLLGVALSLGLPRRLVTRIFGGGALQEGAAIAASPATHERGR